MTVMCKISIDGAEMNLLLIHTIDKPVSQNFYQINAGFLNIAQVKIIPYLGIYCDETFNKMNMLHLFVNHWLNIMDLVDEQSCQ